jgi:uncharacterized protein involved in response to NO
MRFSMSFLAVAFILTWQGYQWSKYEGNSTRVVMSYIGAALCAAAGLAGVRERHRPEV